MSVEMSEELRTLRTKMRDFIDNEVMPREHEIDRWDAPYYHLPDKAAVKEYLVGRFMAPEEAERAAKQVDTPLDVTKRGVLVFARKVRS